MTAAAARAEVVRLVEAIHEVIDQLASRYDDQWAVGAVLLPTLDDLRDALAIVEQNATPEAP